MSLEGLLSCNIKVENRSISFADILACRVPQGTSVAELRLVLERLGPVVESNPDYQSLKSAGLVLPAMECFKLVPASSWSPEDVKDYLMLYYPDLVGDCDAEELKSITGRHLLEAKVLPAIPQRVWSEIAQSHKSVGTRAGARYFTSHLCKIPSDLGDLVGEHANALPSLNKTQLPEAATKTISPALVLAGDAFRSEYEAVSQLSSNFMAVIREILSAKYSPDQVEAKD